MKTRKFKITAIFEDEVIEDKVMTEGLAKAALQAMKENYPETYVSGAVSELKRRWEVIYVLKGYEK